MEEDRLGGQISGRAQNSGRNEAIELVRPNLGQSETRKFSSEVVIQENVGGLDVAVDDGGAHVLMKILESSTTIEGDL